MSYKIFVINGEANCGKDSFVNLLHDNINTDKYKIKNYSTALSAKTIALNYFNWDESIPCADKDRQLLYNLKKLLTDYDNIPFNETVSFIENNKNNNDDWLFRDKKDVIFFIHVREPDEIDKLKQYYKNKLQTILIQRPDNIKLKLSNPADSCVEDYAYDMIIVARSITELSDSIFRFIKHYI